MKKALLFGAGALLVLAIGGYIVMQFFLGSIVKAGVNKFGPSITQTRVELQGANISPLSGAGTLTGLSVGNPKGWSEQNAFHLGEVHVDVEPFSILGDHIVINEVIIDKPRFLYETKIVASNIGDLLKNIEQTLGKPADQPKTEDGEPIKMEIKRFVLRGGEVTVGFGPTALTLPLPPINLTDLGTAEGGITPTQVAVAVMRQVTTTIISATTQAMTKLNSTSGAAAAGAAAGAVNAIKGLFGGKKNETAPPPPAGTK